MKKTKKELMQCIKELENENKNLKHSLSIALLVQEKLVERYKSYANDYSKKWNKELSRANELNNKLNIANKRIVNLIYGDSKIWVD